MKPKALTFTIKLSSRIIPQRSRKEQQRYHQKKFNTYFKISCLSSTFQPEILISGFLPISLIIGQLTETDAVSDGASVK
jgi:hypothetical protein